MQSVSGDKAKPHSGFTLLELLIVIGILAILATVVVLALNPVEYLKKSRDSVRIQDLTALRKALDFAEVENKSLGAANTVSVSIPDTSGTCTNLGLPALPSGWAYRCVTQTNLRKVDGSGWVPVNLTSLSINSPLSKLPIDPVNTILTGLYYIYTPGESFKLTSLFESEKFALNMNNDEGPDVALYETGSNLNLANFQRGLVGYWKLDEGSGVIANDSSGNGNNSPHDLASGAIGRPGVFSGSTSYFFDGTGSSVYNIPSSVNPFSANFSITAWANSSSLGFSGIYAIDGAGHGFRFGIAAGKPRFWTNQNGGTISVEAATALGTGAWAHIVATNSNGTYRLYVNGTEVQSGSGTLINGGTLAMIGRFGGGYWNGFIDDVRIYSRALSAAEIKAIYNATR